MLAALVKLDARSPSVLGIALLGLVSCSATAAHPGSADSPMVVDMGSFPSAVHGMAFAADSTLYFSDSYAAYSAPPRVYALAPPYSEMPRAVGIEVTTPAGLLWTGDRLYVCDVGADRVSAYDSSMRLVAAWTVHAPWNAIAKRDGTRVVLSNDGGAYRLEDDGSTTLLFTHLDAPFGVVEADDDTQWISEQGVAGGAVRRRTSSGDVVEEAIYPWDNPEGLAFDRTGALWVADTGRGELIEVGAGDRGVPVRAGLRFPITLARSPDGDLWLNSNDQGGRLYRIVDGSVRK